MKKLELVELTSSFVILNYFAKLRRRIVKYLLGNSYVDEFERLFRKPLLILLEGKKTIFTR